MIVKKKTENVRNKQYCKKCMFSRNPIYSLPREGLFMNVSLATITTFPDICPISSN